MQASQKANILRLARETCMILLGSAIYSVGQTMFIAPMHIPLGGVIGIAMIVNYLLAFPVGVTNFVLNIPLLALGYRSLGREFFFKTLLGTASISVVMDLVGALPFIKPYSGDTLLSAVAGGAVMGLGIGLVFRQGGTAGGTDIIAKYINKKRDVPVGNVGMYVSSVVVAISAMVYGNLESALYAMITIFISNTVVDRIVYGVDIQKNAMIITTRPQEVAEALMAKLGRGVTSWDGKGMYTGSRRSVLLIAVHRYESGSLKKILNETDPEAIMLLSEVSEVFGKGFKSWSA